jgi:DNA-directed RNA polymerase subunit M/transcription elongation factor TFIIS
MLLVQSTSTRWQSRVGQIEWMNDSLVLLLQINEACPKCHYPKLQFRTLQLRSADEGSTVFYTCPRCEYVLVCWLYAVQWILID